jgi:replicative DNA helicase
MTEATKKDLDWLTPERHELLWSVEQNYLGSILLAAEESYEDEWKRAREIVHVDDFWPGKPIHRRIYTALLTISHMDYLSVAQAMNDLGILENGDIPYLMHLVSNAVCAMDIEYWAKQVKALAEERRGKIKPKFNGAI